MKIIKQHYPHFKNTLEKKVYSLSDEALIFIYRKIESTCKLYNWTFKTVYGITILNAKEIEIYDTRLHDLVFWYEDTFGNFPLIVNDKGEWIEGQTPLIKFFKPML